MVAGESWSASFQVLCKGSRHRFHVVDDFFVVVVDDF